MTDKQYDLKIPSPEEIVKLAEAVNAIKQRLVYKRGARSTFNRNNSAEFRSYLDALAKSPQDGIVIRCDQHRCKRASALYQKWMGALQWWIESSEAPTELRTIASVIKTTYVARVDEQDRVVRVTIRTGREGTRKDYLATAQRTLDKINAEKPLSADWKTSFIEWLASGEVGVPFILKGLALSPDDIEFVTQILEQNEIEYTINQTQIKAIKT